MNTNKESSIYWNPYMETLDVTKIKELQFKRFKDIFTFAYLNSPAYRNLYDAHGVNPDMIKCFDDINKVPIVNKEFLDKNKSSSIYGNLLAVPEDEVVFYHQTSGTTHNPIRQPDTLEDWYWWAECWATVLWAQGIRENDRVLIAFNYNLFIGFWGAHYGCEKIGAEIVSAGGLTSQQRIEKILELDITTIISTPTYIFRLIDVAKEKGIDLRKTSVKKIICAGEPGALINSTKKEIESQWDCDVYDHIGATEIGAWGFECSEKSGGLHINESMFLVEILDLDTHEIITEPNKYGYLVITALHRKGRPCIRFNSNDLACWQDLPCTCNRTYRMLKGGVKGRIDHLIKVRGTFVTPAVIEDIVQSEEKLGREYIIQVSEKIRKLELVVETACGVADSEYDEIRERLRERIYSKTFLNFVITLKKNGELQTNELKSKRYINIKEET
ncbi:phenylacetate--CoA ligase family protein [Ruminiclostridium josui]|uniref:phenylacetate--CoA ligase family protein n=1 Tax=Ruminiclostridium josui TaxID=1499 RepID=UPI000465E025|nr:AMP-binding protein [Ruminiclostridium josui]